MSIPEELMLTCRKLFLRNHEINVHIGVHEFEKHSTQRILVNVELFVLLEGSSSINDHISEVIDYDFIRMTIANRIKQGHIELQETLCDDIANALFVNSCVRAVRVSTEKPDIYPDCDAVGVQVFKLSP